METEPEIIRGQFKVLPKKKSHLVILTRKSLTYGKLDRDESFPCSRRRERSSISLTDIYGAKAYRGRDGSESGYFHVYYCLVSEKQRERRKICFEVSLSGAEEANSVVAEKWVRTILWLVKEPEKSIESIEAERSLPPSRKLLILINPFSGSGKSLKMFHGKVEPMLQNADIDYRHIITEYAGHAGELMLTLDLLDFDGIVVCSGDGLVFEVVNGLMKRPDWKVAINIPLGVIPTGSGNALSLSALYATGQPSDLTSATFGVIRGQLLDLDICSVVTPTEKLFAFLSVTWGLVSDVDIESEKFRFLGETRFLLGSIVRIFGLRFYRGRLSYLPIGQATDRERNLANVARSDEEGLKIPSHHTAINVLENYHGGEMKGAAAHLEDSSSSLPSTHSQGPIDHLLPPLNSELPSHWVVEEGEFILGCPVFLTHLGTDLLVHPEGKFGDGVMGIFIVKSGAGRLTLLDLFGKMKDGSHVFSNHVKYVKALAFRLEPDTSQEGIIAVDGEKIDYVPIQGQIHKALAKLMCAPPPQK